MQACLSVAVAWFLLLATAGAQAPAVTNEGDLAAALRDYFAAADPRGKELKAVIDLAARREDELVEVLRSKRFVLPHPEVARHGRIDATSRFLDEPSRRNAALFSGPATDGTLRPLVVYVPDAIDTGGFVGELQQEGIAAGRYVFLVPDEARDNRWLSSSAELDRHTGPLRDLLLQHAIDPDRLYMVGSGRGGHATWDVGLVRSGHWAGLFPCNGGLIHEGGFAVSGGVFVENGKDLTIFTVYNTSFDHGIEACRNASQWLRRWGTRFQAEEEATLRLMGLDEAMAKLQSVVRNAHPRTITKIWNRRGDGAHYWLEGLDRVPREWDPGDRLALRPPVPKEPAQVRQAVWAHVQQQCARFTGTIGGNLVRIDCRGVGRLRLWLDPELVDFRAKVTVIVNGKSMPPVQPRRRLDVLLPQVHATGDTSRLYWDRIEFAVPR